MKRLTTYRADGRAAIANNDNATPKKQMLKIPKVIDRLAAYEDTGLEPEEIGALKSREKGLVELLNGVSCGCAVTYTRLRELARADRDGRCVVLPVKPDQTIYQWRIGDDCPSVSRLDGVQINADGEITYPIWNGYLIPEDFGKTIFLTREEAALRREQDEKGGGSE